MPGILKFHKGVLRWHVLFCSSCWIFAGLKLKESLKVFSVYLCFIHLFVHSSEMSLRWMLFCLIQSSEITSVSALCTMHCYPWGKKGAEFCCGIRDVLSGFGFLLCVLWGVVHMLARSCRPLVLEKFSESAICWFYCPLCSLCLYEFNSFCIFKIAISMTFQEGTLLSMHGLFCQVETEHTGYFVFFTLHILNDYRKEQKSAVIVFQECFTV